MHVVTGAFSFTGSFVATELLARGEAVKTLSRRRDPGHPLAERVRVGRLAFEEGTLLAELRGASTLYNTYWIRFPRGAVTWDTVLANTRTLLRAARRAGVERIVHFSVSNAAEDSPYPYFRAKARSEADVRACGLDFDILRPTLIMGRDDVVVNNIAWALRRLPVFAVPGDGAYRIQPVAATDVARIAVDSGLEPGRQTFDVAGPEAIEYAAFVRAIRDAIGAQTRIVHVPALVARALAASAGLALRDVVVTREELRALMDDQLISRAPPLGATRFEVWLAQEAETLGAAFVSDRRRHWQAEAMP
jgi:uncharacterized protein YbjT (DUF2867 family)